MGSKQPPTDSARRMCRTPAIRSFDPSRRRCDELPDGRDEVRPDPVADLDSGVVYVVGGIPHHDVGIDDRFGWGHELGEVSAAETWVGRETLPVLDLVRVVAEHPQVAKAVGGRGAIAGAGGRSRRPHLRRCCGPATYVDGWGRGAGGSRIAWCASCCWRRSVGCCIPRQCCGRRCGRRNRVASRRGGCGGGRYSDSRCRRTRSAAAGCRWCGSAIR